MATTTGRSTALPSQVSRLDEFVMCSMVWRPYSLFPSYSGNSG
jgi:hypothetical protein